MSVRLIHIADVHLDERRQLAGQLRIGADGLNEALASTMRCLEHIHTAALARGPVDAWVIAGDLFDTATPTQREIDAAIRYVHRLSESAPVIVIAGNHDVPMSGAGASALVSLLLRPGVHVVEVPRVLYFDVRGQRVGIACVPYPRRAELVAMAPTGSREERNAAASQALAGLVQGLRLEMEADRPDIQIAVYHGSITGALVGAQPRTMSGDIEVSASYFAGYQYVAAGHIHRMQTLAPNVWYAGSPDRCDHDEARDVKGALDVTVDGQGCTVTQIVTPARRYVTLSEVPAEWEPGVVYRVRATVGPTEAEALRRQIAEVASAGAWISADLTVTREARVRDEAATATTDTGEMLGRWLAANAAAVDEVAGACGAQPAEVVGDVERLHRALGGV